MFLTLGVRLRNEDGCSITDIEGAEKRLGVKLPASLHAYYLVAGRENRIRSEWEAEIIALLQAADCAEEPPFVPEDTMSYRPGPITGRVALEQLWDRLVAYLESEEYVDIATNGPRKAQPPWRYLQ
jgi:hypothetical protein